MPRGLLSVCCAGQTSKGRRTGGILIRCEVAEALDEAKENSISTSFVIQLTLDWIEGNENPRHMSI